MKTARAVVLIGVLGAASIAASVYTWDAATSVAASAAVSSGELQAQAHLVGEFAEFAGSESNARSLAAGLRQGEEITLVARAAPGQSGRATRFTPPTPPMDYTTVRVALVLAREQLAQLGVTRPTPAQIEAVLAGGGIASRVEGRSSTPFLLPGVLQMRAGGMSWARIAGTVGLTLAQALNVGSYPAGAAVPTDSARPAAARAARGVVPVAAGGADAPALQRAGVTQAPISSASITTSSAGGPTTRSVIRLAAPTPATVNGEPRPKSRRSKAQVVAAADGAARKETATVHAPDSPQGEAVRSTAASAAAVSTDEPARSGNVQPVD